MNRKFVKENKRVLREFLGKLIVNILTKKNKRALDKVIAADPTLRKNKDDMIKLSKKIQDKISGIEKSNPKLAQSLRKAYL